MIRAYLLLGTTALLGNGMTLAPIVERYHRLVDVPAALPAPPPPPSLVAGPGTRVTRSADGLFRLTGWVEGRPVAFVVDTGATVTVLSGRDAARVGLAPRPGDRAGSLVTAGGSARMSWKRVDRLAVAGTRVDALEVAVGDAAAAHSLLGQDVLSRIGAITIAGDRLEVRPTAS